MQIKRDDEITPDQMVAYYRQHLDEFTTPDRVKWEELMVRLEKYPSSEAAYAALARMGNQVLAGANFADVAKAASDGADGAQRRRVGLDRQGRLGLQGDRRRPVRSSFAGRPTQPDHQGSRTATTSSA